MKNVLRIAFGLGSIAAGIVILAAPYVKGVYSLIFDIGLIQFYQGKIYLNVLVYNPTRYTYPVPQVFFNVFDTDNRYMGSIANYTVQYVKPGANVIKAQLLPNYTTLSNLLTNLVLNSGNITLLFDGEIKVSRFGSIFITQPVKL